MALSFGCKRDACEYIGIIPSELAGEGNRKMIVSPGDIDITFRDLLPGDLANRLVVGIVGIEAQFVPDPKADDQHHRNTDGKPAYIDQGMGPVFEKMPPGRFQISFEHMVCCWGMGYKPQTSFASC